jgi:tetratricopeptide (TPR) repeat protein
MSVSPVLSAAMQRARAGQWFAILSDACLAFTIVVVPGLAAATFERGELVKQALFIGCVALAFVLRACRAALSRRLELRLGWTHVVLAVFGLTTLVSSLQSVHPYLSIVGQFGQRSLALSTVMALFVFAYLIAERAQMPLSGSSFLFLSILGSLGLAGASTGVFFQGAPFTSVGSVYALTVYLAVGCVIALGCVMADHRRLGALFTLSSWPGVVVRGSAWFLLIVALLVLTVVNFWVAWVMVLVGAGVLLSASLLRGRGWVGAPWRFMVPMVVVFVAIGSLLFSKPLISSLPGEVSLSQRASWEVVQQTLVAHPWLGSGPGTWVYDYALYRPSVFNASPFWATRFDRGVSFLLTLFATTGMVGGAVFLALVLCVFGVCVRSFLSGGARSVQHGSWDETTLVRVIVFSGWLMMVVATVFYPFNVGHQVLFWLLTGCLMGESIYARVVIDGHRGVWAWLLPLKAVGLAVAFLALMVTGGQTVWAQWQTETILSGYQLGRVPLAQVIERLQAVRVIHPWDDVSARALAQAYLLDVMARIKDKPVAERAAAVGDEVAKMVDLALESTRRAPANPDNWANAGLVYGTVASFTQGAETFALTNYQEAMKRDPQNPEYPYQVGSVLLLRVQQLDVLAEAKDIPTQRQAVTQRQQVLEQVLQWTDRSLALKADYLPAHYQRAIVFHRIGRTREALQELEQVVAQDPSVDHLFELGVLYAQLDQKPQAMNVFEKVLGLDAGQVRARWQLASLYEEAGRLTDAVAQLRIVAGTVPTNTAVQKRLRVLEDRIGQVR